VTPIRASILLPSSGLATSIMSWLQSRSLPFRSGVFRPREAWYCSCRRTSSVTILAAPPGKGDRFVNLPLPAGSSRPAPRCSRLHREFVIPPIVRVAPGFINFGLVARLGYSRNTLAATRRSRMLAGNFSLTYGSRARGCPLDVNPSLSFSFSPSVDRSSRSIRPPVYTRLDAYFDF